MTEPRTPRAHGADPVRTAFQRASAGHEPRIDGLIAAVPGMMAEARRRRTVARSSAARISLAASSWLPRLAATAALLVVLALLWPSRRSTGTAVQGDAASALETWVVTGNASSTVQDPVLDALVREGS